MIHLIEDLGAHRTEMRAVRTTNKNAARGFADLITPRLHARIETLAFQKDVDAEREATSMFRCELKYLSRRAAQSLINQLEAI